MGSRATSCAATATPEATQKAGCGRGRDTECRKAVPEFRRAGPPAPTRRDESRLSAFSDRLAPTDGAHPSDAGTREEIRPDGTRHDSAKRNSCSFYEELYSATLLSVRPQRTPPQSAISTLGTTTHVGHPPRSARRPTWVIPHARHDDPRGSSPTLGTTTHVGHPPRSARRPRRRSESVRLGGLRHPCLPSFRGPLPPPGPGCQARPRKGRPAGKPMGPPWKLRTMGSPRTRVAGSSQRGRGGRRGKRTPIGARAPPASTGHDPWVFVAGCGHSEG